MYHSKLIYVFLFTFVTNKVYLEVEDLILVEVLRFYPKKC